MKTNLQKKADVPRSSYAHATKIRSAVSHYYARVRLLGRQPWVTAEDGTTAGNPSLAPIVANYMVALQRHKVWISDSRRQTWEI